VSRARPHFSFSSKRSPLNTTAISFSTLRELAQSGNLAYDSGTYRETLTDRATGKAQKVSGTYLTVYRRMGEKWLIAEQMWALTPEAPPPNRNNLLFIPRYNKVRQPQQCPLELRLIQHRQRLTTLLGVAVCGSHRVFH